MVGGRVFQPDLRCRWASLAVERVVDAVHQVVGAYFVFIGSGRLELTLKEQMTHLGLEPKVYFIDTVSLPGT